MNPLWILTLIVGAAGTGTALWLVARLLSYRHALDARCGEEFSLDRSSPTDRYQAMDRCSPTDRYQSMAALLSSEDVEFLAAQPGVTAREVKEFKREQRAIFRGYLTELTGDFQVLHARARELATVAPEQHADLVGDLMKKQVAFWTLLLRLEIQLALAPLGVRVDARPIVDLVGSLGRAVGATGPVPVS